MNTSHIWTEAETARLIEHFNECLSSTVSAAKLCAEFGLTVGRGGIAAKKARLNLYRTSESQRLTNSLANRAARAPAVPRNLKAAAFLNLGSVRAAGLPIPKLRCVALEPRNVALLDLRVADCRYPVSGEGAETLFCGHGKRDGYSYCTPHLHLTRGPPKQQQRAPAKPDYVSEAHARRFG